MMQRMYSELLSNRLWGVEVSEAFEKTDFQDRKSISDQINIDGRGLATSKVRKGNT